MTMYYTSKKYLQKALSYLNMMKTLQKEIQAMQSQLKSNRQDDWLFVSKQEYRQRLDFKVQVLQRVTMRYKQVIDSLQIITSQQANHGKGNRILN